MKRYTLSLGNFWRTVLLLQATVLFCFADEVEKELRGVALGMGQFGSSSIYLENVDWEGEALADASVSLIEPITWDQARELRQAYEASTDQKVIVKMAAWRRTDSESGLPRFFGNILAFRSSDGLASSPASTWPTEGATLITDQYLRVNAQITPQDQTTFKQGDIFVRTMAEEVQGETGMTFPSGTYIRLNSPLEQVHADLLNSLWTSSTGAFAKFSVKPLGGGRRFNSSTPSQTLSIEGTTYVYHGTGAISGAQANPQEISGDYPEEGYERITSRYCGYGDLFEPLSAGDSSFEMFSFEGPEGSEWSREFTLERPVTQHQADVMNQYFADLSPGDDVHLMVSYLDNGEPGGEGIEVRLIGIALEPENDGVQDWALNGYTSLRSSKSVYGWYVPRALDIGTTDLFLQYTNQEGSGGIWFATRVSLKNPLTVEQMALIEAAYAESQAGRLPSQADPGVILRVLVDEDATPPDSSDVVGELKGYVPFTNDFVEEPHPVSGYRSFPLLAPSSAPTLKFFPNYGSMVIPDFEGRPLTLQSSRDLGETDDWANHDYSSVHNPDGSFTTYFEYDPDEPSYFFRVKAGSD